MAHTVVEKWTCDVCGAEHKYDRGAPDPCPTLLSFALAMRVDVVSGRVEMHVCNNADCPQHVGQALVRVRQETLKERPRVVRTVEQVGGGRFG